MLDVLTAALPSLCSAAILALSAVMFRQLKVLGKYNKAFKNLQKDRILQMCRYWQEKGYIPAHEREVLIEMADSYHEFGGNSFVSHEVGITLSMPQAKGGKK